ncbi:MAG TPA: hypothetical protein VGG28_33845 [Kofleriaceae bacterium]|jgi:hypothetical protein
MHVAEIATRLGDTTLDIVRIGPGERFTIGALAGVQLAVAGIGEFPLVESRGAQFVVRAPVGTPLRAGDRVLDDREHVLVPHARISLVLGLARVDIELARDDAVMLPRPPFDARPAVYTATALAAHLALWAAAAVIAPFVPVVHHRPQRPRLIKIAAVAPRPMPKLVTPKPVELDEPSRTEHVARSHDHAKQAGVESAAKMVHSMNELAHTFDAIDVRGKLDEVGPVYGGDDRSGGFGTVLLFDPDTRPEFDTVKTGRYATISHGSGAGDGYDVCHDGHIADDPQHPGHHICVPDDLDQK